MTDLEKEGLILLGSFVIIVIGLYITYVAYQDSLKAQEAQNLRLRERHQSEMEFQEYTDLTQVFLIAEKIGKRNGWSETEIQRLKHKLASESPDQRRDSLEEAFPFEY